jgi:ADP-heptose:LPS heptosyltransferase
VTSVSLSRRRFRSASGYYRALASEAVRPALRLYGRLATGGRATRPEDWRKGLLIGETHIGDVLYNTASLDPLRRGLPHCDWFYLAERPAAEVLEANHALRGVITRRRPRSSSAADRETLDLLRGERFDAAICYNSGRYWPDLLLAVRLGIPNRVGYVHNGFSGLVTHPVEIGDPRPYPAYFRGLVAQLVGAPPDWPLRPTVVTTPADERAVDQVWSELRLGTSRPILACFVTTRQASGSWPPESFAATVRLLEARHDVQVVLSGARADAGLLERLRREHGLSGAVMAGRLSLPSMVAFLRRCRAVLTTDSGPRHLANAAGAPVFFLRNLGYAKHQAGVYCDTEHDLAPDAELVPPHLQQGLLRQVTPEQVAETIGRALAG